MYLKFLCLNIHLQQGITEHMAKATAIVIAVFASVVVVVVDLWELQTSKLQQIIIIQILMDTINLT